MDDTAVTARQRDEALTIIGHLAEQAGPRRASSPAEATAAAYLNARLRRAGMRVDTRELRALLSHGPAYLPIGALGLAAAAILPWQPPLALILAASLLALLLADSLLAPLPTPGQRRPSQNIVGNREIDPGEAGAARAPRWRVILLAPLDSPAAPAGLGLLAAPTRGGALARLAAVGAVALAAGLSLALPGAALIGAPLAAIGPLLLLLGARAAPAGPAESDGGIGALAALIIAAQRLTGLRRVELWAVGVGATAGDTSGVELLARRFPFPPASTLVIGIQSLSQGQLVYATRAGALLARPADRQLLRLAAEADAADTAIDAEPRPFLADDALAAPLGRRGIGALTLLSQPDPAAPARGPADPALVDRAARLIVGVVRRLDAGE